MLRGTAYLLFLVNNCELKTSNVMKTYRIAVIPGDGIGMEVVPETLTILEAVAAACGIQFQFEHYDYSCAYYQRHGAMMPADGLDRLQDSDTVFLGAVGYPGVPDHVSLWGLLIPIRGLG